MSIAGNGLNSPAPVTTGSQGLSHSDRLSGRSSDRQHRKCSDCGHWRLRSRSPRSEPNESGLRAWFEAQTGRTVDLYVIAGLGKGEFQPETDSSSGAPATTEGLNAPAGVAVDGFGNVLIADSGHNLVEALAVGRRATWIHIRELLPNWIQGYLYAVAGGGVTAPTASGLNACRLASNYPSGVATDSSDDLVIADTDDLAVEVLAGSTTDPSLFTGKLVPSWTPGNLYVVAGGGTDPTECVLDRLPTSPHSIRRTGVAVDAAGNVLWLTAPATRFSFWP